MIQSMTGYGKGEALYRDNKIVAEIRSVNGKGADISIKSQIVPREKELELRKQIASRLLRGNIDLFVSIEAGEVVDSAPAKRINRIIFNHYYSQISEITSENGIECNDSNLISTILKLPDVIESSKESTQPEETSAIYEAISTALSSALNAIEEYRAAEGKKLREDITERVTMILKYLSSSEECESQRSELVKEKLKSKIEEFGEVADRNRLEQEIIYYLERLDITEEKVRLRQHCSYFLETIEIEEHPGKKLGFIAQEIGREINTLGSKANEANIQRYVVQMKDELEKIKEQLLNIL